MVTIKLFDQKGVELGEARIPHVPEVDIPVVTMGVKAFLKRAEGEYQEVFVMDIMNFLGKE